MTQPVPHPGAFIRTSTPHLAPVPVPVPVSIHSTPVVRPVLVPQPTSLATIPQVPLAAPPISSLNYPPHPGAVHSVSYSTVPLPQPLQNISTHTTVHRNHPAPAPRIARHTTSPAAVNQDIVRSQSYRHSTQRPPAQSYYRQSIVSSRPSSRQDGLGLHVPSDIRRSNSDSRHLSRVSYQQDPRHSHHRQYSEQQHHQNRRRSGSFGAYGSHDRPSSRQNFSSNTPRPPLARPLVSETAVAAAVARDHARAHARTPSGGLGRGARARTYSH